MTDLPPSLGEDKQSENAYKFQHQDYNQSTYRTEKIQSSETVNEKEFEIIAKGW
jgi:hypothetical protein